jgi:hypothetical protein
MSTAISGLTALATVVILFVVIGMVSAFGSDIINDTQSDFTEDTQAYNNTVKANEAIGNLTTKMPTLATVLIGAFIILILVSAFAVFGLGR